MITLVTKFGVFNAILFVLFSVSVFGSESGSDINRTLTEARAIPHFENGKPTGSRKLPGEVSQDYEKLELKDGDVITGIDGESVASPSEGMERLEKKSDHLERAHETSILRSGRKVRLRVNPD